VPELTVVDSAVLSASAADGQSDDVGRCQSTAASAVASSNRRRADVTSDENVARSQFYKLNRVS